MNLYPLELKLRVLAKQLGITLHLIHPPHLVDRGGHPLKGVNARYHGGDDASPTNWVVRAGVENREQLQTILNTGVRTIALIEKPDIKLVYDIGCVASNAPPNLVAIELGNEVDLTGLSVRDYSYFLESATFNLKHVANYGGDIITGGISRVRPDTLKWLRTALHGVDPKAMVGIHRYSIDNDATIPQAGYVSREEECNAILEVANSRRIAITEFGYPLLDGCTQTDVDKIIKNYQIDLDYFSKMGASYAIAYQWLNGTTNTPIDRFGIRALPQIQALLRDI